MGIVALKFSIYSLVIMEVSDIELSKNRDWDPNYLRDLMMDDFYELNDLWQSNIRDGDLVPETDRVECECYCPLVEDISLEDEVLCSAVEKIEEE